MSKIATLFIVQTAYPRLSESLNELVNLHQSQDAILLLEDGVFALHQQASHHLHQLYVLESDAHLITGHTHPSVNIIDYAQFAALIADAKKVITWK